MGALQFLQELQQLQYQNGRYQKVILPGGTGGGGGYHNAMVLGGTYGPQKESSTTSTTNTGIIFSQDTQIKAYTQTYLGVTLPKGRDSGNNFRVPEIAFVFVQFFFVSPLSFLMG